MIFGLSVQAFTALHVVISLVGIVTGLVAMVALANGHWRNAWQQTFLITTAATSITGFLFPITVITPALLVGAISMLVLAVAFAALLGMKRQGRARPVYAISAMIALYLNLFVLVVQSFLKIPALHALAPAGTEMPFVVAQFLVLLASIVLGRMAVIGTKRIALTA